MMGMAVSNAKAQDESGVTNNATGNAYGYFTTNIGGGGDHPPPYAPGIIAAPVTSPTLFSVQGLPAQVKGFPLLTSYFFSTAYHDVAIGSSDGTKIVYNGAKVKEHEENEDRKIYFNFNGYAEGEVVGSITIQSRKNKADEVDVPTLIFDATHYIDQVKELRGYNVTLLSLTNTLTYSMGVDTRSTGLAASPFVSGFINGPAGVLAGITPSIARSGGVTVPTAVIGCTFLVLIDSDNRKRVDIRASYGRMPLEEDGYTNGYNRKKKYEAEHEK
jgi:hypothetical protein